MQVGWVGGIYSREKRVRVSTGIRLEGVSMKVFLRGG